MIVTVIEGLFEGNWVPLSRMYFKSQSAQATRRLKHYQSVSPERAYRLAEWQRVSK